MKNRVLLKSAIIKAGTTIQVEEPFVFVLSSKERMLRCDQCFMKEKLLKCSGCQYVHYCGRLCQKEAWADHKPECPGFKKMYPRIIPDAARLMARIIRKVAKGGGYIKGYYSEKSFRLWKDLMSHYQDLKNDAKRMDHFTALCAVLFEILTDIMLPNSTDLMGIYGRMCINGFTILDPEMLSVGTGIYLGCSIIDHSCEPNAVAVFHGTTIHIRTLIDMPSLDWSKIRISYIDLLNTPYERQMELKNSYYFLCQCIRCLNAHQISLMHAAKCPNEKCDYPVQIPWRENIKLVIREDEDAKPGENGHNSGPENGHSSTNGHSNGISNGLKALALEELDSDDDEDECPKCNTTIGRDFAKTFKDVMNFTYMHLQNMSNKSVTYIDVCQTCLERQNGIIHPLSLFHVQTLDLALDACIQYGKWDKGTEYAKLLLPGFKNYYGERHPLYGLLLVKLGKLKLFVGKPEEAFEYLKQAGEVLRITHGTDHVLWKESFIPLLKQAEAEIESVDRN